ncbi:MAG TPA: hypothetical protein VFH26_06855 [Gemmatimonadales bacterium]|nr:hypothetical protein [Gemmatimonadales bacterium]
MAFQAPVGRRGLDVVFAVFLLSGLLICATIVAAIATYAGKGDKSGMGAFALGMSALLPSILAWVVGGIRSFMRPKDAEVRLAAALATVHLFLWVMLIALGRFSDMSGPPGWLLATPIVGTACYGVVVTWLALRWFLVRRRRFSVQAAA